MYAPLVDLKQINQRKIGTFVSICGYVRKVTILNLIIYFILFYLFFFKLSIFKRKKSVNYVNKKFKLIQMKRTIVKGNIPLTTLNIGCDYDSFVAVNLWRETADQGDVLCK